MNRETRVLWMVLFVFLVIVLVLCILSAVTDANAAGLKSMPKNYRKATRNSGIIPSKGTIKCLEKSYQKKSANTAERYTDLTHRPISIVVIVDTLELLSRRQSIPGISI